MDPTRSTPAAEAAPNNDPTESGPTTSATLLGRLSFVPTYGRWNGAHWVTVSAPLTETVLDAHIAGELTVGVHPAADGVARAGIIDVDLHLNREPTAEEVAVAENYAKRKHAELVNRGIKALLVRGHSAGSYHIWFWVLMIATVLGRWLREFAADAGEIHVDTFPGLTGGGNAVRLPGRHHRHPDQWSAVWDGTNWVPWPNAIHRLATLSVNAASLFPEPGVKHAGRPPGTRTANRPGDIFNLRKPIEDVLRAFGWKPAGANGNAGDRTYWTREGKNTGVSASVKDGTVYVHTSSVPGLPPSTETGRPYTSFEFVVRVAFGGDFTRATRELVQAGYCLVAGSGGPRPPGATPVTPYTPFPVEVLPPVPRKYVQTVAAAMNCDPAFSALPVLATLGAALGGSHFITPKDGWKEPPYIWAVAIGRSGAVKSPPYRDVEDIAEDVNDRLEIAYETELAAYNSAARDAVPNEEGDGDPEPKSKPPVKKAFVKGDVTIEALVGALQANPRGLLIAQDELNAWIGGFVKYSGKSGATDLPRWLQLSNAGTLNYTRKTGDPDKREVRVRGVGVSVTGTIQPRILSRVLTEDFRASGLLARLLVAMPPWQPRLWTEAVVTKEAREDFAKLVNDLHALPYGTWPDGRPCPHLVRLSEGAKARFIEFYNSNGEALATADEDTAAAMSKLEGYALRFALIFHVARLKEFGKDGRVTAADMAAAIRLTEWFRDEAARVYAALGQTAEQRATYQLFEVVCRLADRMASARDGFRGVTARDLQNHNSRKYPAQPHAEAALESLVGAGLGAWSDGPDPGRAGGHKPRYFVPAPTSDTSYTCSDKGSKPENGSDGGASDTRPDPPPRPPVDGAGGSDATDCGHESFDAPGDDGSDRVSEASDVGREQIGSTEARPVQEQDGAGTESECRTVGASVGRDPSIVMVTDSAELPAVVAAVKSSTGPVGVDTETTGLDPRTDRVRLIQIATSDTVYVIDMFAVNDASALADLFAALAEVEVAGHNLQFDLRFLAVLGFVPGRLYDTMLASQVLHAGRMGPNNTRLGHKLTDVVARELSHHLDKTLQLSDWSAELTSDQIRYAALDVAVLPALAASLKEKLAAAGLTATADIEMRALPGVAWLHGITFDRTAWLALADTAAAERDRLVTELRPLSPGGINWNSPKQVVSAFAAAGVTITSTADEVLAGVDHPLARTLRVHRGAAKRASAFGAVWADEHVGPDGRVRPGWHQLGAVTGRMSCSAPNLQQVPKAPEYRRCFVAPPGSVLIRADYSQIELRIVAKIANDERMIAAYATGEDLHILTAATLLKKSVGEVTKADRQLAKAVNFGLIYGQGAEGLRQYAFKTYGVQMTTDEAAAHRAAFFAAYPGLRRWHRSVGDRPADTRTLCGRRRLRVERFTERLNSPVQGTGADGLKAAIARLWERRAECPRAVPILYVHDEVVVEVPEADAELAKAWVARAMIDGMTPLLDPVPVGVEGTVARTWAGD